MRSRSWSWLEVLFTEKEEQAQQLTGRCPSLLEATIEELVILLDAEPIGRRKSEPVAFARKAAVRKGHQH